MRRSNQGMLSIFGVGTGLLVFSLAVFILMATLFGLRRQTSAPFTLSGISSIPGKGSEYLIGGNLWDVEYGEWVYRSNTLKSLSNPAAISLDIDGEDKIDIVAYALTPGKDGAAVVFAIGDRSLGKFYRIVHSTDGKLTLNRDEGGDEQPVEYAWVGTNLSPFEQHRYTAQMDRERISLFVNGEKVIEISDPDPFPLETFWILAEDSSIALVGLN